MSLRLKADGLVLHYSGAVTPAEAQESIILAGASVFSQDAAGTPTITLGGVASVKDAAYGAMGDGATDDSAAFQAAVNALAGTGVALFIPSGTYKIASAIQLPAGKALDILGVPGLSILKSTMAYTGVQTNSIFYATQTNGTKTGKFASTPTQGANTCSYTVVAGAAPVANDVFLMAGATTKANSTQVATVLSVSGVGPYTLTLDRPILPPFVANDTFQQYTARPQNIRVSGVSFTGTGDRAVQIAAGYRCVLERCTYDTSGGAMGDMVFSFDNGGQENRFLFCRVDCGATAGNVSLCPYAFESNEDSIAIGCVLSGSGAKGFTMFDCMKCRFVNCSYVGGVGSADAPNGAFIIGTDSAYGSIECFIEGCSADNVDYGAVVSGARHVISKCLFDYCVDCGIYLTSATYPTVSDCSVLGSGSAGSIKCGLYNSSASTDAFITNLRAGGLTVVTSVSDLGARTRLNGIQVADNSATSVGAIALAGTDTYLSNFSIVGTTASNWIVVSGSGKTTLKKGVVSSTGASGICIYQQAGTLDVGDVRLVAANSFGLRLTAGAAMVQPGCDFTGCSTPTYPNVGVSGIAMAQGRGTFTSAATTGTVTLTQTQAMSNVISTSAALTGALLFNVPAGLPGLVYDVENLTSNAFAVTVGVTGGTAITVAQGKRARVMSDGTNMQRVTADT